MPDVMPLVLIQYLETILASALVLAVLILMALLWWATSAPDYDRNGDEHE